MIQGQLVWLGNFTSWVTNSSPSGVKLVETMWLFIKNVRSSHMCGLKFMFTFPNRNSRIRSKNYISSKFVNREWRPIKGLWMMMPGSLALVWCIPLSPASATWNVFTTMESNEQLCSFLFSHWQLFLFFSVPRKSDEKITSSNASVDSTKQCRLPSLSPSLSYQI